jgi:hypothetical protein
METTGRKLVWLENFTGFNCSHAVRVLARSGVNWREASEDEIRRAIDAHIEAERVLRKERRAPVVIDGVGYTRATFAKAIGISEQTLQRRENAAGSLIAALRSIVLDGVAPRPRKVATSRKGAGRKSILLEIDGETRTRREWLESLGISKQAIWKAALLADHSTAKEIAQRVRARRSAAAHAPASVASDQPRGMVPSDRAVSACAASGLSANDAREVAA